MNLSDEVEMPLTHGMVTIIDAKNLPRVNPYKWHARHCGGDMYYAACTTSVLSNGTRRVPSIYPEENQRRRLQRQRGQAQ
jgi:hypothetical protein